MSTQFSRPWLILLLLVALTFVGVSWTWAAPAHHAPAQAAAPQQDVGDVEAVGHVGGITMSMALTEDAHHAFLGVGAGLHTFDITDPAHPRQIAAAPLRGGGVQDLVRMGNTLYAASYFGLRILNVSNPGQPTLLGQWDTEGGTSGVAVAGSTLYLADGGRGLRILNVNDPASPQLRGTLVLPGNADKVQVAGNVVYVSCQADYEPCPGAGLIAVDVSDPAHPTQLGAYDVPQVIGGLAVIGDRAYLAAREAGLIILDVSQPASMTRLGAYDSPGWATDVAVVGDIAYLADSFRGSVILDVSNPAQPTRLGGDDGHSAYVLAAAGSYLCAGGLADLHMIDVSQPASPTWLGQIEWPFSVEDAFVPAQPDVADLGAGTLQVNATSPYGYFAGEEKLWVMDLSQPASPSPVATITFTEQYAKRLYVANGLAYVLQANFGLEIFDVSDPLHPTAAGKYRIQTGARNDIFAAGDYAYVLYDDGRGHLIILDMSDPAHPQQVGGLDTPGQAKRVVVAGDYAYVADGDAGLRVIDVSNPAAPAEVGHLAPPEGTRCEAIFVEGTIAHLGCNGSSGAWVQRIEVMDPTHPLIMSAYHESGSKQVRDIEVIEDRVFVAVMGGSLWELSSSMTSLALVSSYHAQHTAGVESYPTNSDIYHYLSGSSSYGEDIVTTGPPGGPPSGCAVVGRVLPAKAKTDGCKVIPPRIECKCGQEEVSFSAESAGGWALKGWDPGPNVMCPASGESEAVANFTPTLSASGSGDVAMCPKGEGMTHTVLNFGLTASTADDWQVTNMTFQATGNGDDKKAVKKVRLYRGGAKLGEKSYAADNGAVQFSFPKIIIPAGQTETFRLEYEFDPEQMQDCSGPKQTFGVTLTSHNAEPVHYPPGLRSGSPQGQVEAGCVKLNSASGQFIAFFDTIQAAVDAASAHQIVEVCPGTYEENVDVPKSLIIRSRDGRDVTTVQAQEPNDHVFDVRAHDVEIRGFAIRDAKGTDKAGVHLFADQRCTIADNMITDNKDGVLIDTLSSKNQIFGNWIVNNEMGVVIDGSTENVIGGKTTEQRNMILDNDRHGIEIRGSLSEKNTIQGNYIGMNESGGNMGNGGSGVSITDAANGNLIGGTDEGEGNVIAYNQGYGVDVDSGIKNAILANSIYNNQELGINLNEKKWANSALKSPAVTELKWTESDQTIISGNLQSEPNSTFRVEFFSNGRCDRYSSAHPQLRQIQGKDFLTSVNVHTDAKGAATFNVTVSGKQRIVTATATKVTDGLQSYADTSEFALPDLAITGIEVTQAIQDLENDVILVKNKETLVRVFVRSLSCDVPDVTAALYGGPGEPLTPENHSITALANLEKPDNKLAPHQRPGKTERMRIEKSFNFYLPPSWVEKAGWLFLTAEVNPECQQLDGDCQNNTVVDGVEISDEPPLYLALFNMVWQSRPLSTEHKADARRALLIAQKIKARYPVPSVRFWYKERPLTGYTYTSDPGVFTYLNCIDQLNVDRWIDTRFRGKWTGVHYYGFFGDADGGLGSLGRPIACGGVQYSTAAGPIAAHEIGHNHGLTHICRCGEPFCRNYAYNGNISPTKEPYESTTVYGYDFSKSKQQIYPPTYPDMMTYCGMISGEIWISNIVWERIRNIRAASNAAQAAKPLQAPGEYILTSGIINLTQDTAELNPFYHLADVPAQPLPTPGDYALNLYNDDTLLASYPFTVTNSNHFPPEEDQLATFVEAAPYMTGTNRIELMHKDQSIASRLVSSHAPTVSITSPLPGDVITGTTTITWTASDTDGDELSYILSYSGDDGDTWHTLVSNWSETSFDLNTATIAGSDRALLQVIATDGVNTAQATTGPFRVERKGPWLLAILAPEDGDVFAPSEVVMVRGAAWDTEDGDLADEALSWQDSVNGVLGRGEVLRLANLTPGYHTITLTATDSDGLSASDSVTIYIGHRTWLPLLHK